jgi:alkanesulfonate monooxygenase SsuD/methylene tetrahydromethanopterin reductase-like flavin-dependent oxidoreductase (luciferase family)/putative sterol carrier protein
MRFGLFYEHQLPRPWREDSEEKLLTDALDQIELADKAGFDTVWEVEHHFLEEYSHSSAPEVFLAAASQRTKRIRLGHGIVQLPPGFNHPARVAERIATLDLVSGGRVEFGTGEASSQMELGGFGVDRDAKRAQWEEALDVITRMLVETPFTGHLGRHLSVPPRNVIPKPKQRPHPPLWAACSRRETILLAASKGIGALSFSFVEPEEAKQWVDDYYAIIASDTCVPAGFDINHNVAVVLPFMLHNDEATAIDRGIDGGHFFGYSLAHYYVFGEHRPGHTDLYDEFERNRDQRGFARNIVTPDQAPLNVRLLQEGMGSLRGAIGTPEQVTKLVERYQAAGVDQVIFVAQAGRNRHEDICESIELFAQTVLPRFATDADARDAERTARLADARERALRRRQPARTASTDHVVTPQGESGEWGAPAQAATVSSNGRTRGQAIGEAIFRRAVRGRSDAYLERIFGTAPALRILFRGMEKGFVAERARGFTGELQYELSTRNGPRLWTLRVTSDAASAHPGPAAATPAVIMRMPLTTFVRVAAGEEEPGHALMDGRLTIDGDLAVASRISEMFGGPSPW